MALDNMIYHEVPVKNLVISASHNFYPSREASDRITIKEAEEYRRAGADCISYKFKRARDAIDENKALMPIYEDVPMLAHKVIHRVRQGYDVAVVGSMEVGIIVAGLSTYLDVPVERLQFVKEGTSLAQNILKGAKKLNLGKYDAFGFEPADTPLAVSIDDIMNDPDVMNNILIANINGKEPIFKDIPELFPRNYYWHFFDEEGNKIHAKEPNIWIFSPGAIFDIADDFYNTREGGKLNGLKVLGMLGTKLFTHYDTFSDSTRADLWHNLWGYVKQKFGGKKHNLRFSAQTVKEFSKAIFDAPMRFKAIHNDPFRLKDIDAWHDLWYHQHIINETRRRFPDSRFGGLEHIIPDAEEIHGFNEVMQSLKQGIGVLQDFKAYVNQRARDLKMDVAPFNDEGNLQVLPAKGENIPASVDYLIKRMRASDPQVVELKCTD